MWNNAQWQVEHVNGQRGYGSTKVAEDNNNDQEERTKNSIDRQSLDPAGPGCQQCNILQIE